MVRDQELDAELDAYIEAEKRRQERDAKVMICAQCGKTVDQHSKKDSCVTYSGDKKLFSVFVRTPEGPSHFRIFGDFLLKDEPTPPAIMPRKHSHYFKPCPFDKVDIYRLLTMYEVTDPCIQHAVKKLLLAGDRGAKDEAKDVQEAIDTLLRWQEMRAEEAGAELLPRDRVACSELK